MTKHKKLSFIKSGLRIFGFLLLIPFPFMGIAFLILAETYGILEEKDEK